MQQEDIVNIATLTFVIAALTGGVVNNFVNPAAAQTVRFGTVAQYPPYNYLDSEGELQGFEADLGNAICARAALDCYWVPAPWSELISQLDDGEFDVIMTGLGVTQARKQQLGFSTPYISAGKAAVLALKGAVSFSAGATIGVETDSLAADYGDQTNWNIQQFDSPSAGIKAVLDQRISGFLADQTYLQSIVARNPDTFTLVNKDIPIDGEIAIGTAPSSSLLPTLNSAISSLQSDGTINTLISKWFSGQEQSADSTN